VAKFRKKPVVIEAVQWSGSNWHEILDFAGSKNVYVTGVHLHVRTLEGDMSASPDDWIIRGVENEVYACKPGIFRATYEEVEE
jgi:hypothetical protein